ncbi:hypothetical protein CI807_14115 [Pseudomonas sp. NS1(2017)]|uniref:YncE family protein n=1 Tax=Pseudomonas sp. NS1(2017) TaxID=2025658 RepID=UPI000BA1FA12|nr:YncE family protein [Pseudomonas sp. NS1(2017)]ASV37274.1 hypothetical protein CI807_14115 [Pseudomonas sp. NS1(2017)]
MTTTSDDQVPTPSNAVLPYVPPSDEHSTRKPDNLRRECFTLPQPDDALLTPQSFRQTQFADLPLYLPTQSNPVVGFHGGLNSAALEVSEKGVACILLSYLGQTENDFIELMLNDVRVAFHTVTEEEARDGAQIVLYALSQYFIREAGNRLQAFVTPVSGNKQQTQLFNIKVDDNHPAGLDPQPSTPENENLAKPILPQKVIDFGVDSETAGRGVPVIIDNYPVNRSLPNVYHRKVRDRIRLSIGGVILEHSVTEFEASGSASITIWVYAATWALVGSGVHLCEYNVIDEVGNASRGFSPAQELEVRLDDGAEPLLRAAYIDESEQDAEGRDQLNADHLNGNPATIIIPVRNEGYLVDDTIRVRVNGVTGGGIGLIKFYDFPVVSNTINTARILWPFADILPLVKGRIHIIYQRLRTGVLPRNSNGTTVNIVGTPGESDLPAPIVEDAIGGTLPDPDVDPFLVRIKSYPGQLFNDYVKLVLQGTRANGSSFYAEYSDQAGTGDIFFDIRNGPNGPIAPLAGGFLDIHYEVNDRPPSIKLTLNIGAPQASLPAPTTRQAVPPSHIFDPLISKANLNVIVRQHASFVRNAIVTLHFEGSKPSGSNPPIRFTIDSNWVGKDLAFTIARNILLNNLNGSAKLYYTVDVPGQPGQLISHDLVITIGSALDLAEPHVLEATLIKPPSLAEIDPINVLPPRPEVVTIRVTYAMLASDNVKVRIIGEDGSEHQDIAMKPGIPDAGESYITFTTPNRFVGVFLGRTCRVFFEVVRDGATTPSRELTLEVKKLPQQLLDVVSIPEAEATGVIDANSTNSVEIDAWSFFRLGQRVWISLHGDVDLQLRAAGPVTLAEFNAGRTLDQIPQEYLRQLNNGGSLTVKASVSLDGTGDEATMVHFTWITYGVRKGQGEIIREITVGNGPAKVLISTDGTTAYVVNSLQPSGISIVTLANSTVRTISYYYSLFDIALHPKLPLLYLAGNTTSTGKTLYVYNTNSFTYTAPFNIGGVLRPICLNFTGTQLCVGPVSTTTTAPTIYNFDTSNYSSRVYYYGGQAQTQTEVITNPRDTALFLTGTFTQRFTLSSGVRTHNHNNAALAQGLAHSRLNVGPERLYVANSGANSVLIFNTENNGLTLSKTLTGISDPRAVAFHPSQTRAYVTELANNCVRVIDTITEEFIGSIYGFNQPRGITFTPDEKFLLVTNYGGNTLSVVSI